MLKKISVFDGNTADCADCVEQHLESARSIINDAIGMRVDKYRVVWHLASAASKAPSGKPELFHALLDARRKFQRDGVVPDWDHLIKLLSR